MASSYFQHPLKTVPTLGCSGSSDTNIPSEESLTDAVKPMTPTLEKKVFTLKKYRFLRVFNAINELRQS